ncbi:MAG TPA: hypothetical protein VHT53_12330 [Candidatus Elarobacter sp.]|jgi:hypothetical protein|nr:hypothetical protein [Candidatus Elarobacter sp.]
MDVVLATSIDPIEVAFVRAGVPAVIDVAAVRAVECGALEMRDRLLVATEAAPPADDFVAAVTSAATTAASWSDVRDTAARRLRGVLAAMERRLCAAGLLREPSPWRWLAGRRTARGAGWLRTAQLAFPAEQIAQSDPALALALHGPRSLGGTRYARRGSNGSSSDGCGASFSGGDGHGGHGGCGSGGGHGGCGSGCGGGGCGGSG